jgi:hypothetical protein
MVADGLEGGEPPLPSNPSELDLAKQLHPRIRGDCAELRRGCPDARGGVAEPSSGIEGVDRLLEAVERQRLVGGESCEDG